MTFSGSGFLNSLVYSCNFSRPASLNESWVTPAIRVSDETLICPLPASTAGLLVQLNKGGPFFLDLTLRADWPSAVAGTTKRSESTSDLGRARVLVYRPPSIFTIWPNLGSTDGGTPVYLRGERFSLGLAQQMWCRFGGDSPVPARVISASGVLLCVTPSRQLSEAAQVTVEVSVDGLEYFGSHPGSPVFTYHPPPTFEPGALNIQPHRIGADMP